MPVVGKRFRDALVWAAELHEDQTRKGGNIPYVGHLLGVSAIVLEHGGNEDQAIAALLHDALEDQAHKMSAGEIRARFGDTVERIVEACTDGDPQEQLDRNKAKWRMRKEKYIAAISAKPPASVDYAMRKSDSGWKIVDITAEGISLVLTYRSEFEQIVQQAGIDGLIKRLAEKNTPATK